MSFLDGLKDELKKQPWYVWAGAAAGGGAVLIILVKQRLAASSTASQASQANSASNAASPLNGYDLSSMAGLPYGFENGPLPGGSNPPGSPPATTITQQLAGLIRPKETSGPYAAYDKNHTGVPLRSVPGGSQAALVPFGATVQITGNAVSGPMNSQSGTSDWYPISYNGQAGYVSSADLANIFQQAASGGGSIYRDVGLQPEHVGWL